MMRLEFGFVFQCPFDSVSQSPDSRLQSPFDSHLTANTSNEGMAMKEKWQGSDCAEPRSLDGVNEPVDQVKSADSDDHVSPEAKSPEEDPRSIYKRWIDSLPEDCNEDEGYSGSLHSHLLGHERSKRLFNATKVAISYWHKNRDTESGAYEVQNDLPDYGFNKDLQRRSPHRLNHDMQQPGMGLELECFSSFLSHSMKERFVREIELQKHNQRRYYSSRSANRPDISELRQNLNDRDPEMGDLSREVLAQDLEPAESAEMNRPLDAGQDPDESLVELAEHVSESGGQHEVLYERDMSILSRLIQRSPYLLEAQPEEQTASRENDEGDEERGNNPAMPDTTDGADTQDLPAHKLEPEPATVIA